MNKITLILGFVLFTTLAFGQNWQNEGFTPGQEIAYDQNGNTLWKLTHNNIYKSTNGGATWNQNIDQATAPFYQEDYLPTNFGTFYPIFDADNSRVHGDFMFLALRTDFSNREYWTTPDAGLTFNSFTFDADFFVESYNLGNNRFMIQVADFDNSQPSSYRCKWFYSSNGGQSFSQVLFDYGRNSRIVNTTANSIIFHDDDKIHYHNFSNFNRTQTVTLPEDSEAVRVNGNTIQAVSYDEANASSTTALTLFTSNNGGASFTSIVNTKPSTFIFDHSIIDNFYYFYNNGVYRYDLNNFSNPPTIFSSTVTPRGPFKKTLDGQMVNFRPQVFNSRFEDFNEPFYISADNWTTTTPTEKVPYALDGMVNFATTNTRFFNTHAYSTSDGKDYFEVGDFFGSALKSDIVHLDNSMWISTYSDPSSTAYFSNDGLDFKTTDEILNTDSNFPSDAKYYQAGSNLIAQDFINFDPELNISSNNGNTWSKIPGSYLWGRNMFTDAKNGTLYGWQTKFVPGSTVGEPAEAFFAKSTDNGVTWKFIDNKFSSLGLSTTFYNGQQWMAYNNHLFARTEDGLVISSDGGLTFNSVPFPNSYFDACVWIANGELHVDTKDEQIYTLDLDQWLGTNPAPTQEGHQVDVELSLRLEPANPAPFSDFDVIVTVTNTGNFTADNISVKRPFLSSPVAVNRGSEQPTYEGNWTSGGISSIAPGQSLTASFPYYRLDGGEIKTNAYISNMLQPDVDSRAGDIKDENNLEDDEAVFPAPIQNGSVITVNCPDNVLKVEDSPTGPNGVSFSGFGDVILPQPTATTTCPGGIVSIEHIGTAPVFQIGNFFWLDGPGEYPILWEITDACGNTETCLYSAEVIIPAFEFGFANCPSDIFIQAPSGSTGQVVDYGPLGFASNCPSSNTNSGISEGLASGSFFPLGTTRVTHFVENVQCGTAECSFNVNVTSSTSTTGVDLELGMTQSVTNPTAFNTFTRTVTVTNTGTNVSNNVEISIPLYDGMVFSGGEEYEASQGFYSAYGNQVWNVGGIGAGERKEIVITYYALENITAPGYAQITNASGNDIDSTPNNGTPPNVNEDDEASTGDGVSNSGTQITCPDDITVTATSSNNGAVVFWDDPEIISSDCTPSLAHTFPPSGSFLPIGTTEVTYTYLLIGSESLCGVDQFCSFNVTVLPPDGGDNGNSVVSLDCSGDLEFQLTPGQFSTDIIYDFSATTTCTQSSEITYEVFGFNSGTNLLAGTYPVTVTATDACGSGESCSFDITILPPNNGGGNEGIDLELNMTQSTSTPGAYSSFERVLTVTNAGSERANNILIDIPEFDGMVFSGGNEFTASQGFFNPYANNAAWDIVFLDPGNTATITLRYYALQNITTAGYAQVIEMDGQDIDSTPNNGTPPTVNEDDEASTNGSNGGANNNNLPDLTISEFRLSGNIILNEFTSYTLDLNNLGMVAALEDYSIKLYLSTDANLSPNDVFVGDIRTGNTFPGTISDVNAELLANSFALGPQRLIVVVDADNEIEESNESNNITSYFVDVVSSTNTSDGVDLNLSVDFDAPSQTQYESYVIHYTITNEGNEHANNVEIKVPLPTGAVYSAGQEFVSTQGQLGIYFDDVWRVGSLNAGQTAVLRITYYKLSSGAVQHYAQVTQSSGNDADSTPNNGQCCTAVEDDEASIQTSSVSARSFDAADQQNSIVGNITIYPSPSNGEQVYISIPSAIDVDQDIFIYDLLGKQQVSQAAKLHKGENVIQLQTQNLPTGMFFAVLKNNDDSTSTTRFVIKK